MSELLALIVGAAVGALGVSFAAAAKRGDEGRAIARRGYLLEQSRNALDRYGEFRHLAATITRELEDRGA